VMGAKTATAMIHVKQPYNDSCHNCRSVATREDDAYWRILFIYPSNDARHTATPLRGGLVATLLTQSSMGGAEYRAAERNAMLFNFAREKTLEEELHGRQAERTSFRPFPRNGNIAVIFQGFRRLTACVPLTDSDNVHITSQCPDHAKRSAR